MGKKSSTQPAEPVDSGEAEEGTELGIMSGKPKKKSIPKATRAGLLFPVAKVNKHLRQAKKAKRVGGGAPIYLAGVLEYASAEVLEAAINGMGKRKRITPADIVRGVRSDRELNLLLAGTSVFVGDRVTGVSGAVTIKEPAKE